MDAFVRVAVEQVQRIPTPAKGSFDLAAFLGGLTALLGSITGLVGLLVALCSLAWAGLRLHMMYVEWRSWRKKRK